MKIRVIFKITAFVNSQVVYKEFTDTHSASEFIKEINTDKNREFIRIEVV